MSPSIAYWVDRTAVVSSESAAVVASAWQLRQSTARMIDDTRRLITESREAIGRVTDQLPWDEATARRQNRLPG